MDKLKIVSIWNRELWRKGKLISHKVDRNVVTMQGLNNSLDVLFNSATQITAWYLAPFETNTTPSTSTTYAVPVFTECTAYDEANRQAYSPATAAAGVITSTGAKATITWSATKTIYGVAIVGGGAAATTKGDTAGGGKMFCASKFSSADSVEDDDISKIWVQITLANA